MKVRVLGSAAGGGLPQWNCGCANCARARAGDPALPPRTQPSLAVSGTGRRWSLVNADVRVVAMRGPVFILNRDVLFNPDPQARRHLSPELVARIGDEAGVNVTPMNLEIGIHAGKGTWHRSAPLGKSAFLHFILTPRRLPLDAF